MWRNDVESDESTPVNALINKQSDIRWDGFLEGCIGHHWQAKQHQFFYNITIVNQVTDGWFS
jgi:hypothetical protein